MYLRTHYTISATLMCGNKIGTYKFYGSFNYFARLFLLLSLKGLIVADFSYPQILESFIFAGILNFVLVRHSAIEFYRKSITQSYLKADSRLG